MAKIHILDEYTVNQIAAGEVVERPSSIIKELVENSIDAGSSAITIEIKGAGISFIRVTDNGDGMDMQDALLSFERHATSKIHSTPDLDRIHTLGFRGEALASIAAVTQMEMITRIRDNIGGIQIINHGGTIISQKETGCPEGTTIIIKNLFYNTPARLKFLKSPRHETAQISDLASRMILAHPGISFKYINDGKIIYQSPGDGRVESAVLSIYGKEVLGQLLEINNKDHLMDVGVKGFLGKPSLSRTNRNYQSFFVNGRYVKSTLLSNSVESACKSYMMINHFPWVIIYLTMPSELADVNVHPAKTEIRFKEEEKIFEIIYNAVSKAIESGTMVPEIKNSSSYYSPNSHTVREGHAAEIHEENKHKEQFQEQIQAQIDQMKEYYDSLSSRSDIVGEKPKKIYIGRSEGSPYSQPENATQEGMKNGISAHTITDISSSFKIIGRIFSTYIIAEARERIFFIDQHAAHERLIFEKYKEMISKQQVVSQQLLPPIVVEVTHTEQMILNDSLERFCSLGFEIEPFGGRAYAIRGIPAILGPYNIREFFQDLLDQPKNIKPESRYQLKIEDIMQMACKKAVKAHDPLSDLEIKALIERIQEEKIPLTCPHGRPIMVSMTCYELEKMFGRIQ